LLAAHELDSDLVLRLDLQDQSFGQSSAKPTLPRLEVSLAGFIESELASSSRCELCKDFVHDIGGIGKVFRHGGMS
jgi:hypothetical protein